MSEAKTLARVCETVARYFALGNESFSGHGATFVRNTRTSRRYDANHTGLIRSARPGQFEALLAQADTVFAHCRHRRIDIDALTPPSFEARLALDGSYTAGEALHLLLEGDLQAKAPDCAIREVLDEADWAAYSHLAEIDRVEDARKQGRMADLSLTPEFTAYLRAKTPQVRFWLACLDGMPVGFLNSWPGDNGVGQVEDLFTHPDFRHRGIATALIAHCVADCRARGAGPVVITANPHDTPRLMYAAMGFRPVSMSRTYLKSV
jgi:GNAT superfamily N-acetyltransferase